MVYPAGKRDAKVQNIADYCKRRGTELRTDFLQTKAFDSNKKKTELRNILRINGASKVEEIHQYTTVDGWDTYLLSIYGVKQVLRQELF